MTITATLSGKSLQSAAKQLRKYAKSLETKSKRLVDNLGKAGVEYANMYLEHDDTGETRSSIQYSRDVDIGVISVGGAAVWIEFGTGVLANGGTPHPKRDEVGAVPWGEYGEGKGKGIWWFYSERYQCYKPTAGIHMNPFMYETSQSLRFVLNDFAKEAFRK